MRYSLSIFLCYVSFVCFGQTEFSKDTVYFDKFWAAATKANYEYFRFTQAGTTKMPFAEVIEVHDFYKTGKLQMIGFVSARDTTKPVGMQKYYDRKGRLESIMLESFRDLAPYYPEIQKYVALAPSDSTSFDILRVKFHKRGKIDWIEVLAKNDTGTGTVKDFNQFNTNLFKVWDYRNKLRHGRKFSYWGNGQLWHERYYKNGKRNGTWKHYTRNGRLRKTKSYGS